MYQILFCPLRFQDLDLISRKSSKNQPAQLKQSKASSTVSLDTSESSPVSQTSSSGKATPPNNKLTSSPALLNKSASQGEIRNQSPTGSNGTPGVNIVVTKEDGVTTDVPTFSLGEEEDDAGL